jgi:hypothetical protein
MRVGSADGCVVGVIFGSAVIMGAVRAATGGRAGGTVCGRGSWVGRGKVVQEGG